MGTLGTLGTLGILWVLLGAPTPGAMALEGLGFYVLTGRKLMSEKLMLGGTGLDVSTLHAVTHRRPMRARVCVCARVRELEGCVCVCVCVCGGGGVDGR